MHTLVQNLLQLLSNQDITFFIPPYQRNYEWGEEDCKALWNDIVKAAEKNKGSDGHNLNKHFFGTVTYFKSEYFLGEPVKVVLIDGQQRITSTMLFLLAVRDTIKDVKKSEYINNSFLVNARVTSEELSKKIKLKQVEADWEAYKSVVNRKINDNYLKSRVVTNYEYFRKMVSNRSDKELETLINKGLSSFDVVTLQLELNNPGEEKPQEIFESMNSLGKPLSLADLVRNYMLISMQPAEQEENYHKYWLVIEKNLSGYISDYIRDFMQLQEQKSLAVASESNHKELYAEFKNLYSNPSTSDSINILESMAKYSEMYSWIIGLKKVDNKKIECILGDLRKVKVATARSFLLSLLISWQESRFSDSDIIEILESFRIYILRRRLLLITKGENKEFPVLTKEINSLISCQDKKRKMFEILSNKQYNVRLPNDIEVIKYLESANLSNFQNTKFYLSLIEEKITKKRPDIDKDKDENIQLEHILPQKLNNSWKTDLGENFAIIHQENLHLLGNLTLIRHNQELSNKPFSYKKDFYQNKSGLQIARKFIIDNDFWNEKTIKTRTQKLSKFLVKEVLPIPDDMRTANNYKDDETKPHKGVNFKDLGLIGKDIYFLEDPNIKARVVSDDKVEYNKKKHSLSGLTKIIKKLKSCNGFRHWGYDGKSIYDLRLQFALSDDTDDIDSESVDDEAQD